MREAATLCEGGCNPIWEGGLATHAHARARLAAREGGLEHGLDTHTRTHSG